MLAIPVELVNNADTMDQKACVWKNSVAKE